MENLVFEGAGDRESEWTQELDENWKGWVRTIWEER